MKQVQRWLDFVNRYVNFVAMIAILILAVAWLLGIGNGSSAELLNVQAWWRAAGRFLRQL